ncbi:MAG: TniB family NTP-binding protein [Burkholderiaceae bacterium]|nr:TniB family NTP-binding protein [Burkholderiaceae bacterium]
MTTFKHLAPEVAEALTLPKPERIQFCNEDRWVGYTRAVQIIKQLDDLLTYPKTLRLPNVVIVGRGGNGISSFLVRFAHRHPILISATGSPLAPVLRVELPETPDESEFWSDILWALGVSHREKESPAIKKRQAKRVLQYADVRILVIDEFNNLTNAGKKAGDLLAAIKGLSNDLKIPIVAAGTQAAISALNSDPQMKSRFEPAALDRWKLDAEYLRFLASYERLLPLAEPSQLASRDMARMIYGMTGEALGETVKLLKKAACHAVESGVECINEKVLKSVPWTVPGNWEDTGRRI